MANDVSVNLRNGDNVPLKAHDLEDGTHALGVRLSGVGIHEGALDVHIQEIHTNAVNQEFHMNSGIESLFAIAVTAQDRSFTVVDSTGFAVEDTIEIYNGVVEPQFPQILSIVGNVITINRPVDRDYGLTDGVRKIETNLAIDGSVTPMSFKITGESSTALTRITRVLFEMTHGTAGDLGLFGNLPSLTNGIVVRVFKGQFNFYKTITVWKTNADIKRDMFDVEFDTRSSGGGTYGTSGRASFTAFGMEGEYDPTQGDFLEVLVQDDLTGLITFKLKGQGHTED